MAYKVQRYCPVCEEWREVTSGSRAGPSEKRCKQHGKPYRGVRTPDANGYMRKRRGWGMPLEYEHRIVWEDAYGPIPPGYHVHHKNHVRHDNRLENLELVEGKQHNADHTRERHAEGSMARGKEKALWRHDIDDDYISKRYAEGATLRQIGKEVGASHGVVVTHLKHLGLR